MQKIVDYYMNPASPWTYLGHEPFRRICDAHGATIRIKPIDLGRKVFPVSGGVPVGQRAPQRQAYRLLELDRWHKVRGVPLNLHPKFFPVATDDACRLIVAADLTQGIDAAMNLAGRLLRAVWADELDIADERTLRHLVRECGLSDDALWRRLPDTHQPYEAYTQEAIERGVFGAPWYQLGDEPFWGQDRLELLERALARPARAA